jgi:ABC-type sugar transport system ATPase subunit
MNQLVMKNIVKKYDDQHVVLQDICVEVKKGEFIVIVGPSGCGKTTLLRIIAGLEEMSSGDLFIGGRCVNRVSPSERDIGMVFQDYALYPHMTVYNNMAFGLKMRRLPKNEIKRRVYHAVDLLQLDSFIDRKPAQLSGGQRQRVAIGRAIVKNPKVFLFDEPLSNLDAQLRAQMRIELSSLHRKIGSTTVYVTHDQAEAMTLADRVVLLKNGRVQQIGRPQDIYNYPNNQFVGHFVGNPGMNFIKGKIVAQNFKKYFIFGDERIEMKDTEMPGKDGETILGIRPESLTLLRAGPGDFKAEVALVECFGHEFHVVCRSGSQQMIIRIPVDYQSQLLLSIGSKISVRINREKVVWFDALGNHLQRSSKYSPSLLGPKTGN